MNTKNQDWNSLAITLIGLFQFIIGLAAAFFGSAETYCYSLFQEGGSFHYKGFGFGSFMFGSITLQIWGYYAIALVFIPLGYGHLRKQGWIQRVSLALLYDWFIVGFICLPIIFYLFISAKAPSLFAAVSGSILCLLSYSLIPLLLIKFYKSRRVERVLNLKEHGISRSDEFPVQLMMLTGLYLSVVFALHVLLLFKGIFSCFGRWLTGIKGIIAISSSIVFLILVILGTLRRNAWAWRASLVYFVLFISSSIVTLISTDFIEVVTALGFPATEAKALVRLPFKGYQLAGIFGLPMTAALILILKSKRLFTNPPMKESA